MKTTHIHPRLLEIFLEVIKIEGLSTQESKVAAYIFKFLKHLGLNPQIDKTTIKTKSNTGNVICKIGKGGDLILCSHMDTARSTINVNPIIKKDRIVSDGKTVLGVDNRVGISILLFLAEKIITEKLHHQDFTLVFTTCEETSLAGSGNLKLHKTIKKGFIFDSNQKPGNYINRSFGAASFEIKIIGKEAHSGIEPEKGINALLVTSNALGRIKIGKLKDGTTVNFGRIEGGTGTNVVPGLIFINGEVRSNSKNKINQKIAEIKKVFNNEAKKLNGKINFKWRWDFAPYFVSSKQETTKDIRNAISKSGLKPKASFSKGGSDANSFNANGISAVNIGIGAQNPHSNDEFILFEDFEKDFEIAYNLVRK